MKDQVRRWTVWYKQGMNGYVNKERVKILSTVGDLVQVKFPISTFRPQEKIEWLNKSLVKNVCVNLHQTRRREVEAIKEALSESPQSEDKESSKK